MNATLFLVGLVLNWAVDLKRGSCGLSSCWSTFFGGLELDHWLTGRLRMFTMCKTVGPSTEWEHACPPSAEWNMFLFGARSTRLWTPRAGSLSQNSRSSQNHYEHVCYSWAKVSFSRSEAKQATKPNQTKPNQTKPSQTKPNRTNQPTNKQQLKQKGPPTTKHPHISTPEQLHPLHCPPTVAPCGSCAAPRPPPSC